MQQRNKHRIMASAQAELDKWVRARLWMRLQQLVRPGEEGCMVLEVSYDQLYSAKKQVLRYGQRGQAQGII